MAMQNVSQVSNTMVRKPKPITLGGLDAAMARRPRLNANSRRAVPGAAPSVAPKLPPRLAGLAAKDPAAAQARYAGFLASKQTEADPRAAGYAASLSGRVLPSLGMPPGPTSMGPGGPGFESPPIAAPQGADQIRQPMVPDVTAQAFADPAAGGGDGLTAQAFPGAGGPGLPPEILQRIAALRSGGMGPGGPVGGVPGGIHGAVDPTTAGQPGMVNGAPQDPNQTPPWAGIPGSPMGGKAPIPTLGAYGRPGIGPRPMQL